MEKPPLSSKELYLRLLRYVRPYWRVFAVSIVSMVVLALSEPAIPALLKPLLDGSFVDKDPEAMRLMPLWLVLLFLVRGASSYSSTIAISWVANKVVMDLREAMFDRLLHLPSRFYNDNATGVLMSKVAYDVSQVTDAATNALVVLVRDSIAIIGLLAWMLYLNWKLTLLVFLAAPLIALVVRILSRRLRKINRSLQHAMGEMAHTLEEALTANRVVKVFNAEEHEARRFHHVANWVRRHFFKLASASAANTPLVQLIAAVAFAVIIYIAIQESTRGDITVGGFVSFFGAMGLLFSPLKRLTSINEHLQRGLAAAESVFGLLDQPPEPDTGQRRLIKAQGAIEFVDVTMHYDSAATPALMDVDLRIAPGESIALVGPSGSGKTTLVNLLPRFYVPTQGRILLDGIDIQDLPLQDLRRQIALVSQEVTLFNDTIAANIAYGILDRSDEASIVAAAEAAHAMEFIQRMPEGLQTLVGEKGARLSGGQRQRIAIARALLKNAPVLILDEATSALDTESERHVQAALENLQKNRTTLIIAHRLSTVERADRIVAMERGRIVEIGNHSELLSRNGLYARLYRAQHVEHGTPLLP